MGEEQEPDAIEEALALARRLPGRVVAAVFQRYGKPLAEEPPPVEPDDRRAELTLDDGAIAIVRALEVRTQVDVIGNDWFVLEAAGAETLALPGPLFAASLAALSRARGPA
jgi:hypothetical protein